MLAQGARPSQPGHFHEPQPQSKAEETLLNRCSVRELPPQRASSPVLKHLPLTLNPPPLRREYTPTVLLHVVEGEEDRVSGGRGTVKHDRGGLFLQRERWVLWGWALTTRKGDEWC